MKYIDIDCEVCVPRVTLVAD